MRKPMPSGWEGLTTQQYLEIVEGHDIAAWQSQQEAFAALRDLCDEVAAECRTELDRLRENWTGQAMRAFETKLERVLREIDGLRDSAASNSDGMREMTALLRELAEESRLLRSEDDEWRNNPDDDDPETVRRLRENLRGELRDTLAESDAEFQRLSASYLSSPPAPVVDAVSHSPGVTHGEPENTTGRDASRDTDSGTDVRRGPRRGSLVDGEGDTLEGKGGTMPRGLFGGTESDTEVTRGEAGPESTMRRGGAQPESPILPPVESAADTVAEAPDAVEEATLQSPATQSTETPAATGNTPATEQSAPMMPMGGGEAAGGAAAGAAGGAAAASGARGSGPVYSEASQQPRSRMRSRASRQELHNEERYGEYRRPDPRRERRATDAAEDSPLGGNATVVPPVVSGGAPPVGPHDSGPVMTGTVYRHFPEYGREQQAPQQEETFEDGARAEVRFPSKKDKDPIAQLTTGQHGEPEDAPTKETASGSARPSAKQPPDTPVSGADYLKTLESLPRDQAAGFAAGQQRLRADESGATGERKTTRDGGSRDGTLADQRRRRREARERRRRNRHDDSS